MAATNQCSDEEMAIFIGMHNKLNMSNMANAVRKLNK